VHDLADRLHLGLEAGSQRFLSETRGILVTT
jgi:hypothetical protein